MGTELNEDDVLSYDPFQGDFGSSNDRTLKDKMVTARKAGECHMCAQFINPGDRIRSRSDIFDGEMMYFRWCPACCKAMADSWTDDGFALEERTSIGTMMREK